MGILANSVAGYLHNASWIRRMFEAGAKLKAEYGNDKVQDFSLGNPDLPAPSAVYEGLEKFLAHAREPFAFGYMSNAGFPWLREKLADYLTKEQGVSLTANDVILSCGAAGALNAFLRAVIDPGDEMLCFAPYFVEYGFYVANYGGNLKAIKTDESTFEPDPESLRKAISPQTKVLLINSPNNPTGAVYSKETLVALAAVLSEKSAEIGHPIWLVSDEPYRFLAYDGVSVPSVLPLYPYSVCVSSFSKNLSLPGERLGYAALAPDLPEKETVIAALTLTNRILGYVNPPVVGQQIMGHALGSHVDKSIYEKRRKAMAEVLTQAGYSYVMPKGAFYFFPKAPGGDDVAFVNALAKELVLAVPGSGFGLPGYFRLAFCVDETVIRAALPGFTKARALFTK
ncbi:MAG: pyridoxal phosphate-dependent aminotransferase [Desulfovibrionaceae bacterium]|nr:pyridoxal phosphate-dependent aminotransferase [Desulfovibrionaceae bacterium]